MPNAKVNHESPQVVLYTIRKLFSIYLSELAEEGEQYCFQIMFHGPNNRTYYLSTESQSNMEQWMKALTCAGYDYMKLMVAELQRQLDEIEGCKEKTPEVTPLPAPKAPPRRQNPFNRPPPVEYASNASE